jgi:uncharacterized small protein (DUF1192 family)
MTRYLEIKPGSIAEVAIRLRDDYQAFFKKELEKSGKGIAQMSDAEKKAFFNRVDKAYNAKNEATSQDVSQSLATKPKQEPKTTLVAAPGGKEKVIRIPKEKLADYKAKGYVEAEEFVPEQAKNPYAIGMAAAMKATGDKPPLKKSTIVKAHDIAKKIEKQEEVKLQEITDEEEKNYGRQITSLSNDKVMARINKKGDEAIAAIQAKIDNLKAERDKKRAQKNEEVSLEEGQYKEIDTRKGDLRLAKDKRQALKDKYNAIMANQASGDEHAVADQIQKLDMSIKKQEQELIDIMKKSKDSEKKEEVEAIEEAAGPDRLTNLNDKITRLQVNLQKLDKSKPESKTKEAILKSDLTTAKLRLQDLMQKRNTETKKEVKNEKMNYKSMKKSIKKEQETPKKTMTDKPLTKVDVEPKISTH